MGMWSDGRAMARELDTRFDAGVSGTVVDKPRLTFSAQGAVIILPSRAEPSRAEPSRADVVVARSPCPHPR